MANLGLLGALQGLGEGIQTVGKGMEARRERALEEARRMAEYQRQRADKQADTETSQMFQREMQGERLDRSDEANQARIAASKAGRQETQQFQQGERIARAAAAKDLAAYRSNLTRQNNEASIKFRKQLDDADIKGVKPGGPPDPAHGGKVPVVGIRGDGKLVQLPQWVAPEFFARAKPPTEEGESLLPEEDDEEEDEEEE